MPETLLDGDPAPPPVETGPAGITYTETPVRHPAPRRVAIHPYRSGAGRRFEALLWILLLWVAAVFGRLVWLQVFRHDDLLRAAQKQQQKVVPIIPRRGTIFDRLGQPLAKTLVAESIAVNPQKIHDSHAAAVFLAGMLELDRAPLEERIESGRQRGSGFLWVKRKVTEAEADLVRKEARVEKVDWLDFTTEMKRVYPRGPLASHVVGSFGYLPNAPKDDTEHGTSGVEAALEEDLMGRPGEELVYNDVRRNPYDSVVSKEPQAGSDITLTIEPNLQFAAERELDKAMESSNARTGSIVALNPYTGEVLAMANSPRFDPNLPASPSEPRLARSNLAISTPYEPGSVFKVITLSAGLETTPLTPDSLINCFNGSFKLRGRVIHDTHGHGVLSVAEVLAQSSNIGAIQIALRAGEKSLNEYVRRYGFGSKTGIILPGESTGMVRRLEDWGPSSIGSVAMGHEISATALQLALAGAVVANGGMLVKPRVVLARKAFGGPLERIPSDPPTRIIRGETAIEMRQMMEGVVLHGTGRAAILKGYTSAGKTGSAQIYDPKTHSYSHSYNSSFLGFAPVTNPQVVIVVTLNGTTGGSSGYGGAVAAPVFREVAMAALRILDVPKDIPVKDSSKGRSAETTATSHEVSDLPDSPAPGEHFPIWRGPQAVSSVTQPPVRTGNSSSVNVPGAYADSASADVTGSNPYRRPFFSGGRVPDFRGMTLRAVLEESAAEGLPVEVLGSGLARAQDPAPGTKLPPNGEIRIQFGQ